MTTTTETEIMAALAAIELEIPGIVRTYVNAPETINSADMPLFVNLPGPAVMDWNSAYDAFANEGRKSREFYAVLIVAPVGTGVPGEKLAAVNTYFDPAMRAFQSHRTLKSLDAIVKSVFTGDTGVRADIEYSGLRWYGIRFTVQVTWRVRVAYAANE